VDAKAHRKTGVFELKSLVLEPGLRISDRFVRDLAAAFTRCARWHGCPQVVLAHAEPAGLATPLGAALGQTLAAAA
jgi:uncharacterized protein YcaQ